MIKCDKVVCFCCGKEFKSITSTHLKKHGLSVSDYLEKFPDSSIKSQKTKENMSKKMTGRKIGWIDILPRLKSWDS